MSTKHPIRLALVALGLAGAAVLTWLALAPPERFTYAVAALSRDQAVLFTRNNERDRARFWVELVQSDGGHLWSAPLSHFEPREALGYTAAAASDELLVVFGGLPGVQASASAPFRDAAAVVAFDRADGRVRWREALPGGSSTGRIGPVLILDPPRVLVVHERHGDVEERREAITALDLADGRHLWDYPPMGASPRLVAHLLAPGRLLVSTAEAVTELDTTTGEPRHAIAHRVLLCETPAGVVGLGHPDIITWTARDTPARGGPREHTLADAAALLPSSVCGERGGDLVVGTLRRGPLDTLEVGLIRLDPSSGSVRWQLWLDRRWVEAPLTADGRLPRYLPLLVSHPPRADQPLRSDVVVVDLDQGSASPPRPVGLLVDVIATAERAYLYRSLDGLLIAIDPADGRATRGWRVERHPGSNVRPDDFRHGHLWLFGRDHASPSELPYLVVDLDTGSIPYHRGAVTAHDLEGDPWQALLPPTPAP